jgi:hypothetical protein
MGTDGEAAGRREGTIGAPLELLVAALFLFPSFDGEENCGDHTSRSRFARVVGVWLGPEHV